MIKYVYAAFSKLTGVIYSLVLLKLLSLYLTKDDFSYYFIHFNIVLYIASLVCGLQWQIILRYYYKLGHKRLYYLVNSINTINISIFLVICIGAYFIVEGFDLKIIIIASILYGFFQNIIYYLRITHNFKSITYLLIIQAVFALLFIYIFSETLDFKLSLVFVSFGYLVSTLILADDYPSFKLFKYFNLNIIMRYANTIKYAWPLVFIGLFNSALSSMDQYFLLYYKYNQELPSYIANYTIAEKTVILALSVITLVFIPTIFRKYSKLEIQAFKDIFKVALIYIIISIFIVTILFFFSETLTRLLVNDQYTDTSWIIPYIAIGGVFLGVNSIVSDIFTIHFKTKTLLFCYFSGFATNFILNIIFIETHGIKGAIFSTIAAYIVMLFMTLTLIAKEYYILKKAP